MSSWLGGIRIADSSPACHNSLGCTKDEVYMVTQSRLRELFDYQDGNLIRKIKTANRTKPGEIAGTLNIGNRGKEYINITVDGKRYKAHRLIWIWHYGHISKPEIDHIDGNGLNNRIENLREATRYENAKNLKKHPSSKSGVTGVSFCKDRNKWQCYIQINGKRVSLGRFESIDDAIFTRKQAEQKHYAEFARKF